MWWTHSQARSQARAVQTQLNARCSPKFSLARTAGIAGVEWWEGDRVILVLLAGATAISYTAPSYFKALALAMANLGVP